MTNSISITSRALMRENKFSQHRNEGAQSNQADMPGANSGDDTKIVPDGNAENAPWAYTVDQLLERLPIGRTKLYEEIAAGRLEAIKIGCRTLVLHDSVVAYLTTRPRLGRR